MNNREVFASLITTLCEGFGKQASDGLYEFYWLALNDLTEAEFKKAVGQAALNCKFMPSPAELLAFARPKRDTIVEAATAWDGVRRAIDRIDYTVSQIDFGPHVNAVIRQLGGWDALCRANLTDLDVWKRKEFERLYVAFSDKPIGDIGRALEGPPDGKVYPPHVVAIEGIPSQPQPALEAVGANGAGMAIIHALADRKQ